MKRGTSMTMLLKASLIAMSVFIFTSCAEKSSNDESKTKLTPKTNPPVLSQEPAVEEILKTQLKKVEQAPSLTVIMLPKKDLQETMYKVEAEGGRLVYDPNNGVGGAIPFFIVELTPDQINNTEFIKSLNLKSASIDAKFGRAKPIETKITSGELDFTNYIPTESVKIEELGEKTELGKGITVAVIDTGIDASHPAFGDRVVYWYDGTQETRTKFKKVK